MQPDFLDREIDAASPAAPLRKAAMLLHSMSEPDRRWMLARVDSSQRARLEALLAELAALEFPIDVGLVRESLESTVAPPIVPTPRPTDLSAWSADEAMQMLVAEPDDLIALLLRADDWPWAEAVRARLGSERARAIASSRYSTCVEVPAGLLEAATGAAWSRFQASQEVPSHSRATPPGGKVRRAS